MTYSPPTGNTVNFNLTDSYSVPTGDAINFNLGAALESKKDKYNIFYSNTCFVELTKDILLSILKTPQKVHFVIQDLTTKKLTHWL